MADVILFGRGGSDRERIIQRFMANQPLPEGHDLPVERQDMVRAALDWIALNSESILDLRDGDVVPVLQGQFPTLTDKEIIVIGSFMLQVDDQIERLKARHRLAPPDGPEAA